jgi:hypothetical protein
LTATFTHRSRSGNFKKLLKRLEKRVVLVGIPAGQNPREGKIGNAALYYLMETGSPAQNIPPRPTLVPGVRSVRKEVGSKMRAAMRRAMKTGADVETVLDAGLKAAGLTAVSAVQQRIRANTPPPLAESTLRKRKKRGVTRTNTLIDTGEMMKSVTYVIRDKRG